MKIDVEECPRRSIIGMEEGGRVKTYVEKCGKRSRIGVEEGGVKKLT